MREQHWHNVLPFIVGLACFGILAAIDHARGFDLWRNYALSGIFLGSIATWALWHLDVRVPHYIQWIVVAGLLLHYGGGSLGSPDPYRMGPFGMHGINGTYHVFGWWDNLTHLVGIAAGAMGYAYLLECHQLRRGLGWSARHVAVVSIAAALATGVCVELYEFLGKTLFQTIDQGGYINTMMDLLFNTLGAVAGACIAVFVNRRMFWHKMQEQWGTHAPRSRRPTPSMLGFYVFVAVPASISLLLSFRFLFITGPVERAGAYDAALTALTQSALAAVLAAPLAAMLARELIRRQATT